MSSVPNRFNPAPDEHAPRSRPGREPDAFHCADLGGDRLECPGACGSPIYMGVAGDVDHRRLVVPLEQMAERLVEQIDVMFWRSAEAHGVLQVVDLHRERNGDDWTRVKDL